MTIVIPAGPVPPHGRYLVRQGQVPMVSLQSPNGQVVIWLMGGQSLPDPTRPECVLIDRKRQMTGLIPPWQTIDQQGATEDGTTFVDGLYEPMEVQLPVTVRGRDAKHTRRIVRLLFEALDLHEESELGWMTPEMGYWWATIRWFKSPPDAYSGTLTKQDWTLRLRADNAFWQSYPDTDTFQFLYEDMVDEFDIDYADDLGPLWPQYYTGSGRGYQYVEGGIARWSDDPDRIFFTGSRRVVAGPYKDFSAPADDVDVSFQVNNTPEFTAGTGAGNDAWARMGRNVDGTWNGDGIRARIGWGFVRISVFKNFQEVWYKQVFVLIPPLAGEEFTLRCTGRTYSLIRSSSGGTTTLITTTESGSNLSYIDADHRGVGFGMQAGGALITQATPAQVRQVQVNNVTLDTFDYTTTDDLGANWPLRFTGVNDAYIRANGSSAVWVDNSGTETQEVVNGPYRDFSTATNNQVVSMVLGAIPEWSAPESGANDLWARMGRNADGSWNGNGIRARITLNMVKLSAFVNFVEVWSKTVRGLTPEHLGPIIPGIGEKWTLVAGFEGNQRLFKVLRGGGSVILSYKESGTASMMNASHRGIGFGVRAAGALITQATPATIRRMTAGDNAEVTQSGFLERRNAGDQTAYDDLTLYGPAKLFKIANGPGSTDFVEFGPLAAGEVAFIRTDPREKAVYDLTNPDSGVVPTALFGKNPSDQMFRKMNGRFTSDCGIPPKEPGMRVATQHIACSIVGGNAESKIDAALTPLRRYPQ